MAVLPALGAALIALMASGCVSRATAGSLMRETGNVFTARGVLEAAHVLGHGCNEDEGGSERNVALCGSGGGSNAGANLASLGVGTARVAMGLALMAIADATSPSAHPKPLLDSAVAAAPNALDRYEDPRQRSSWLAVQSAACFDRATCPSSLDPRRAIPVVSHVAETTGAQHFRADADPQQN